MLDLIHSDLCGPISFVSLRGFEYYVTFIDDHSRKTWIYFLRSKKHEVLQRFQEFIALVENQTWRRIRALKSDNKGEYTSKDFDEFCGHWKAIDSSIYSKAEWSGGKEEQSYSGSESHDS